MAKKKPSTKKKPAAKAPKKAPGKSTPKPSAKKASKAKPASKATAKKAPVAKKAAGDSKSAQKKKAPSKKPAASGAKAPPVAKQAAPVAPKPAAVKPAAASKPKQAPKPAPTPKSPKSPAPAGAKPSKGSARVAKPTVPVKSDAETFAEAQAAAARLAAIAGIRPIESRPFEDPDANDDSKRLTKSPLSKKELSQYRELLLRKRAEIMGDVVSMEDEALLSGDRMSHTPNHMAEQGSDVYEQTLSLDIAASQRKLVVEIEQALQRIEDGTYGICVMMGTPIGKARLDAKPWAKYCIEAARRLERGGSLA